MITKDNLYNKAWTVLRDWLDANLTDPWTNSKNSNRQKRRWIYRDEPEPGTDFAGLPFIQIADLTIKDSMRTFNNAKVIHELKAVITIKSDFRKNSGDNQELDTLSSEFNAAQKIQTAWKNEGIHLALIDDCGADTGEFNELPVRIRTFTIIAEVSIGYG